MKIIFTGASSFTGFWFCSNLLDRGHDVYATFTKNGVEAYPGIRHTRVSKLLHRVRPIWNCPFGSNKFFDYFENQNHWDCVCHHAAYTKDYKSPEFPVIKAVRENTMGAKELCAYLKKAGDIPLLLSGSVFEADEGAESCKGEAVSPYGLSKTLTWQYFRYFCITQGVQLAKFVIPNPFGPYEAPDRFTSFLAQSWFRGEVPTVKTPAYVRDNIHVNHLTSVYCKFVEQLPKHNEPVAYCAPSEYVETQGEFTERFASALKSRLKLPCRYETMEQTEFSQPKQRYNPGSNLSELSAGKEKANWDDLAEYYYQQYGASS